MEVKSPQFLHKSVKRFERRFLSSPLKLSMRTYDRSILLFFVCYLTLCAVFVVKDRGRRSPAADVLTKRISLRGLNERIRVCSNTGIRKSFQR